MTERTIRRHEGALAFDERPHRFRLGLIALSTDFTSEQDFMDMRPGPEVAVYVTRVAFENPLNVEHLRAMQPRLAAAAGLILPGEDIDAIAYSCTSATALLGDDAVAAAVNEGKPGTPVVTPVSGAKDAFAALGAERISLLSPYPRDVSEALADAFEAGGLRLASLTYLDIPDDRRIARLSLDSIAAAAEAALAPDAQALFISCTALRAASTIETLEARLGITVVTSNQAMFWAALRAAGCTDEVPGYGRLLRAH